MSRMQGKVVIVTGAASNPGLGYSTAITLAREGAKLVVTDLDLVGAEACATAIRDAGGEALALEQDVTDEPGWDELVAGIVADHAAIRAEQHIVLHAEADKLRRIVDEIQVTAPRVPAEQIYGQFNLHVVAYGQGCYGRYGHRRDARLGLNDPGNCHKTEHQAQCDDNMCVLMFHVCIVLFRS